MEMDRQFINRKIEQSSMLAKYIDIKLKFIQDYNKKCVVKSVFIPSEAMAANLLTKVFSAVRFRGLMKRGSLDQGMVKE